jgi:transposase InsO family protein
MRFPLVRDLAAEGFPVRLTCGVLGFSAQAYYRWLARPVSDRDLEDAYVTNALVDFHRDDPAFGYRFLADELDRAGITVGERRVWRLCSQQKLWSTTVRKGRRGKGGKPGPAVHDDHVRRDFTAPAPDRKWVTDITEHPTAEGKVYCCAIKDLFAGRIVGYAIGDRMTADLAVSALRTAIARRRPGGVVIVHADRGSQFRARSFRAVLSAAGLQGSMGRVASAGDNAAMEMLLSVSSGHGSSLKESEEVPGVVALQAPHRLSLRLALGDPAGDVVLGGLVVLRPREDHGVQRPIELAVTAA